MSIAVPLYGFGASGGTGGTLTVTAPANVTVTITKDGKSKTKTSGTSGVVVFKGLEAGTWTVTITGDGKTAQKTVVVTTDYSTAISFEHIYGISRDITAASPAWVRTDDAVGLAATATIGTVAGSSDFDNCYPWDGIARETLSTGDVMVKIPKFWYSRYRSGNMEYIKIADHPASGFTLHPAFNHGGTQSDYIYIGAYKTTSGNKSVSGASPLVDQSRATMRTNAKAKGTGWGIIDISALSAIQMLVLVEFANNNVASVIGRGYSHDDNSAALITGTCDTVSGLTGVPAGTVGTVDVVWRGIEGFWGNVYEFIDGINWNNGTYYVCNDPSKYADDTATNYTALSFTGATNWSNSFITQEGLDTGNNPHVLLPSAAGSGSETTYYCGPVTSNSQWRVYRRGGAFGGSIQPGLFVDVLSDTSSYDATWLGSRLLYIPS